MANAGFIDTTVVTLRVLGLVPVQLPGVIADHHPPSHVLLDASVFRMKQQSSSTIWR